MANSAGLPALTPSVPDRALADTQRLPLLARTCAPIDAAVAAFVMLSQRYQWSSVGFLYPDNAYGNEG